MVPRAPVHSLGRLQADGTRRKARGRITIVQEQRFQLVTDDGRGLLLTLSGHGSVDTRDLRRLRDEDARVIVEYAGGPNLASGVAFKVEELPPLSDASHSPRTANRTTEPTRTE